MSIRNKAKSGDKYRGELEMNMGIRNVVKAKTIYKVECFGKDGKLKWTEEFENTVVTAGLNVLLDATFKTGIAVPTWYVGLKDSAAGVVAGDTMASHAGWTESTDYGDPFSARPAFTPGTIAAGSVDNSASKAVFAIDDTVDIYGAFLCDDDGSLALDTGTLYGAGDFSTPRSVISGDTLNVTVTLTQTAA
jgi:hypothetical protein